MLSAVKCKQNVDPALADALDGAVADMSKMYMKLESFGKASRWWSSNQRKFRGRNFRVTDF